MRSRALSSAALALVAAFAAACGGKARSRNIAEDPQRAGSTLEPIPARFNDVKPTMSRDGTRLAFVSGRDSTDAAPTLKVYKADWPVGGAPGALARATATDFGVEKDVRLSPDGAWLVISVASGAKTDLVLQDFAGTKAAKITDDAAIETGPSFSPDGKLLTWVTRGVGTANASAWVLEIQDDLAAAAAAKVRMSAESESPAAAFFTNAASGYQLAVALQSPGKGSWDVKLKSFASFAEASAAPSVDWLKGFVPAGPEPTAALASSKVALVRRALAGEGKTATTFTAPALASKAEKRPVVSEVVFADATAGVSTTTGVTAPFAAEVLSASTSADGQLAFVLGRNNYLCDDVNEGFRYGAFFLSGKTDGTDLAPFAPFLDPADSGKWLLGSNLCEKLYDKFVRLDDKISELRVNGDAKVDDYRLLYVTRFTKAFDVNCALRVGDPEIMALEVKGTTRAFYPASQNPAPLTNADRGDQPACQL